MKPFAVVWSLALVASSCTPATTSPTSRSLPPDGTGTAQATPAPPEHPLSSSIRILEARTGTAIALHTLVERLAEHDVVFLGETHLDEVTHSVELAVYDQLLARTDGKVVLAMEMFSRADQAALDRYTSGASTEAEFLAKVKLWGNYTTGYRPLIERARRQGATVVGSNVPRSLTRTIAMGGKNAYESLSPADKAMVAPELLPGSDAYWDRVSRAVRGHGAMNPYSDPEVRLYAVQNVWDNTMAHSCAEALSRHPGHVVLHVNGSFHSNYRDGTAAQLARRRPEARIATVAIIPTDDLPRAGRQLDSQLADYVIYTDQRARGLEQGTHAVYMSRELKYRLHVPEGASRDNPVPLLIWLAREGTRSADVAAYWKLAVGEHAAIAVVEMPHRQREETLYLGGRWYWPDSFSEDVGAVAGGVDEIRRYVSEYFAVAHSGSPRASKEPAGDESGGESSGQESGVMIPVVVAGRGAGATVVTAAALYSGKDRFQGLAFEPARYGKMRTATLPGQSPGATLSLWTEESSLEFWDTESTDYQQVGLSMTVSSQTGSLDHFEIANQVRIALGIAGTLPWTGRMGSQAPAGGAVKAQDPLASTLARSWVEIYEMSAAVNGQSTLAPPGLGDRLSAALFADGQALPMASGPFGGTTIVVLPQDTLPDQRAAWLELEKNNALAARSRFTRVQVAIQGGQPSLASKLEGVRKAGRSNVLVVPGVFAASAETMRSLVTEAGNLDGLTVAWLPGLGGRLHTTVSATQPGGPAGPAGPEKPAEPAP